MEPSTGIWYYVWLRPHWKLFVDREPLTQHMIYWPLTQHMIYWPQKVVPRLVRHYKLNDASRLELLPLSQSMPRGRVTYIGDGCYDIYHGAEWPAAIDRAPIRIIANAFGLRRQYAEFLVMGCFREHEEMRADHKRRLQKIIGKVSY